MFLSGHKHARVVGYTIFHIILDPTSVVFFLSHFNQ